MASRDVQVRLGTLDQYLTPDARERILVRIATLAIGRIKRRTGQGKDVDGQPFAPYSRRYARQREQSGRSSKPPTLLLSGAMLASMKVLQSDATKAVIGFSGSSARGKFTKRTRKVRTDNGQGLGTRRVTMATKTKSGSTHTFQAQDTQIANALKAAWNDRGEGHTPVRHFFGLSREEKRELVKDALKQVIEAVREASFKRMPAAGALRQARSK